MLTGQLVEERLEDARRDGQDLFCVDVAGFWEGPVGVEVEDAAVEGVGLVGEDGDVTGLVPLGFAGEGLAAEGRHDEDGGCGAPGVGGYYDGWVVEDSLMDGC